MLMAGQQETDWCTARVSHCRKGSVTRAESSSRLLEPQRTHERFLLQILSHKSTGSQILSAEISLCPGFRCCCDTDLALG
jgi:hypothetical protein